MNKKKKRIRKWVIRILLLLLLAAVVRFIVLPQITSQVTVTYDTYTARKGDISNSLSFNGSMNVKNNETLSAEKDGTVRKIYVTESQNVKRDDRLMRLSTGEMIRASFDGQVNEISVEEGDEVTANQSLIQIVDFSTMTVSLRVDEYSISQVYVGQPCRITITALNKVFETEIAHLNRISTSNGNTAYYTVTCEIDVPSDVLPGMQATVTIPLQEASNAVILSKSALSFTRDNSAYVMMKDENGEMKEVPVTVGVDNDNYVEIKAGLSEGDTVYKVAEQKNSASGLFGNMMTMNTNTQNSNRSTQRQNPGGYSNRNYGNNMGGPGGMR